jgi:hypothetical protein
MEKWEPNDVLAYWKKIHGHKFPNWKLSWDQQFLNHRAMTIITSVDASWIINAIQEYQKLDSVAWRITNNLKEEERSRDPSGLYSPDERGWW